MQHGILTETTADHPFYTDDGTWINAADLSIGEQILSLDGDYGTVELVIVVEDVYQPMYNLTVADVHTFAVGAGAWVVHNVNCPDYSLSNLYSTADENIKFNKGTIDSLDPYEEEGFTAGWTGVYDHKTGKFLAMASDLFSTKLKGTDTTPPGTLRRSQSHPIVRIRLEKEAGIVMPGGIDKKEERAGEFVGFHLSYISEDTIRIGFHSRSINERMSKYGIGPGVTDEMAETVANAVEAVLPAGIKLVRP